MTAVAAEDDKSNGLIFSLNPAAIRFIIFHSRSEKIFPFFNSSAGRNNYYLYHRCGFDFVYLIS